MAKPDPEAHEAACSFIGLAWLLVKMKVCELISLEPLNSELAKGERLLVWV